MLNKADFSCKKLNLKPIKNLLNFIEIPIIFYKYSQINSNQCQNFSYIL